MKILVIEDGKLNQEAARQQLAEHEVTILKSFTDFFRGISGYRGEPAINLSDFDIILTDINLPSPHDQLGTVEGATGFVVAFKALQAGVKMIGIITDANHHQDVYGKALDLWLHKGPFAVGDVKIYLECYNGVMCGVLPDLTKDANWKEFEKAQKEGTGGMVKRWKMMVDRLTGVTTEENDD